MAPVDDALDRLGEALAIYHEMRGGETYAEQRAEQREALATVRSELQRLREERDAAEKRAKDSHEVMLRVYERAEAAEAEVQRYREGLRWFADYGHELDDYEPTLKQVREKARALLADSPDGSGS